MTLKGQPGVSLAHAAAVVYYLHQGAAGIAYHDADLRGSGVNGVLRQLLDHGGRTLYHLAGSYLVGDGVGKKPDYITHMPELKTEVQIDHQDNYDNDDQEPYGSVSLDSLLPSAEVVAHVTAHDLRTVGLRCLVRHSFSAGSPALWLRVREYIFLAGVRSFSGGGLLAGSISRRRVGAPRLASLLQLLLHRVIISRDVIEAAGFILLKETGDSHDVLFAKIVRKA